MRQNYDSSAFRNSPGGYTDVLTQDVCQQLCSDFKFPFAGLVKGEFCLCSNHTDDLDLVALDLCNITCSGSEEDICGATDVDLIYVMDAELMGTVDSISITVDEENIFTDKAVKITLSIEASTDFFAVLYFGDGTSHKFTSEPYEIEKQYKAPGEYQIHAFAVDVAQMNPAIFEEITIEVAEKKINFDILCPRVVEPKTESQCNVTFYVGSEIEMSFKMRDDSEESERLEIPEPFYLTVGLPIPPVFNEQHTQISEEVVYLTYINIPFKVNLLAFEFLVKEKGSIQFMILTPSCSSDKYCEETFGCSSTCSDNNIRTCNDDKTLCSYISQCIDSEAEPECTSKSSSDYDYEVKYTFDVDADEIGYKTYDVPEPGKTVVLPGDILGFKTDGSSSLWCRNASAEEQEIGVEDKSPDGKTLGVRHFVRAVFAEAVNSAVTYMYNDTGNYTVTISASVSSMGPEESVRIQVYLPVQIPVSGTSIIITPENAVVDKTVTVNIRIANGSDINILWEYYDATKEENLKGDVLDEGYTRDITCESSGDFMINVNVSNLWSSEVVSGEFHCFSAITRAWELESNSPKSVPPGEIDFDLKFTRDSLPTSAVYVVDFGDGSTSDPIEITSDSDSWKTFSHSYDKEGEFSVVVNISNPVDAEIFDITVRTIEKMGELSVTPFYVLSGSYPEDKKELHSKMPDSEKIFAPKGSTLYFENSITGHITHYYMDCPDDPNLKKDSTENVISREFSELGEWKIDFKAYNSEMDEYSNYVTLSVKIIDVVPDASFTVSKTSVETDETVEFTISLSGIDSYTCIVFKSGDNTQYLAFGNEDVCSLNYDPSEFKYISSSSRKKRDASEAGWKDDSTIIILYEYAYGGDFLAEADVFNPVSRAVSHENLLVNDGDYTLPLIWIDDNSTDRKKPLQRQRGYDFRMETTAIFRDDQSYMSSHLWHGYALDENGVEVEEIDLTNLTSSQSSALRVTKRFLDYGLYKFTYSLTVYEEQNRTEYEGVEEEEDIRNYDYTVIYDDYYTKHLHDDEKDEYEEKEDYSPSYENLTILGTRTVFTYLEINPTPLIPMLIHGGASYLLRGLQQSVLLEPTLNTVDPDYHDVDEEYEVKWFCHRYQTESLKKIGEYEYENGNPSGPITDRSTIKDEDDKGGCFGKGPGLIEIGSGDYELKCNTLWGFDITYEITAVISRGKKVTEGHLILKVIENNPPSIRVMCEKKVACHPEVQGQFINPNSFINLKVECIEDCGNEGDLSLEWMVYASSLKTPEKNSISDWDRHTQVDMDRMGLNQSLFISNPEVQVYLVEVVGSLPDPSVPKGESAMFLIINHPPENGDCKINATSGMALLDVFLVEFSNWEDEDGHTIDDYSVYVKYGDESLRISYGLKTKVPVVLPYGDIEIWCSIQDSIGGVTMYSAANFTTDLPTEEELEKYESQRLFDKCLAEGKMSMASQIVIAKNSILLEYRKRKNQVGDFPQISVEQVNMKWNEYLELDGIDSSYFTEQAFDEIHEMLQEQLEHQMDKEAKAKNKEIKKLLALPMEALQDAEMFGGALSAVAENGPSDMSANMKLMKGMDNMYNVINNTEVPHPENLKTVLSQFGSLADTIVGSLADSNIGGHFLPSELKQARLALDHNATEPNFFLLYVDGSRDEVQEKLKDRTVNAAKDDQEVDAKEIVSKMKEMVSSIQQECMEGIMVGPEPFYTESKSGFQMTLLKNYASNLTGSVIEQAGSSIILPNMCEVLKKDCASEDVAVGVQSVRWSQPLESYGVGSENISENSNVIQIELTHRDGSTTIPVKNSVEPFIICIPRGAGSETKMEDVIPTFSSPDDILVYHTTFVDSVDVVVSVNIVPTNVSAPLMVIFKYGEQPSLIDYHKVLKVSDIPAENGVHTLIIGSEYITEPEKNLSVAIGQFADVTNIKKFFQNPEKYNLTVVNMTNKFTSNYSISIAVTGCYFFDEEQEKWSTEGCKVSSIESSKTCCECNHLTSFASGFFVAPNQIDFNYVFAHTGFNTNKTIYATLIVLFSVFIILLIFARWKDRKDVQKLGASPLPDNESTDKYIYEILVYTGHQGNAGTKSNVFFIVSGEDDETEVRHLGDDKRAVLQKSSVDVFVMTVPRSLGQLNYLRIWHDNSGKGKWSSWYCQYIVFRDVQTGLKYEFLVDKWFGVEHDDGLIDRLIPVAGKEQVTEFSHLFTTNSRRNLADRHLWFSVFLRPPRSRFTRVQRVSCCMAVLCLSMLANAMYYQRTSAKPSSGGFKFGPFSLSPEQIAVGLICNFIIFPPTFVMVFFFRKSRPKTLRPSHIEEALKKQRSDWKRTNPEKTVDKPPRKSMSDTEAQLYQRKKRFALPWWCVIFGWFFVILSIGASMFFIWAYGIEFGDEKTAKWLTSLVIAFFSSVLLTQPIKVVLMAIVVSCMCRSMDYDEDDADEDEEDPHLRTDEEYLHDAKRSKKKVSYRPMDLEALEEARKEREKEVKMYSVLKEICAYFFFLWVIMILSYGNRDPNNFYLREALVNGFIKPGDLWVEFNNVNTEKKFWNWTYNALVPELFALPWYNGRTPLGLRLFLDDRNNLKIGYAVLRQVRIKPKSCKVPWLLENVTPDCAGFGKMFFEDGTLYTKGWREVNSSNTLVPPEYKYLSASQLRGYPFWGQMDWYGGGGYIVPLLSQRDSEITELLRKLRRLEVDGWIDKHTRAVFVEFGTYNAQINLFCAVTILAEFLPGGGIIPYYHIDPLRLLTYHTGFGFFQMIIEIIFVIFTIFFTYREVRNMGKEGLKYFSEYWNVAEFISLIISYTGIANQVYKLFMVAEILRMFTETKGAGYVKLQEAVLLNELFCYQIGFLMSISTLKFLKLLRFNKRIGILSSTIRVCAKELKSFSICLLVVFGAFVILFWLLLGRHVREFSTVIYSFESSISMMLKKFNYEEMYAASPVFTPIAFFTFSLATAVVLINILLTIIIRSFEDVKRDVSLQSNEFEIFDFFINRMKLMLGCGKAKVRPQPSMYRDVQKKPEDSVTSFPSKVDKLVDFINDFYFENQMDFNSKDFLKKMNADGANADGKLDRDKKKSKPVMKGLISKIPKTVSDRFDDF